MVWPLTKCMVKNGFVFDFLLFMGNIFDLNICTGLSGSGSRFSLKLLICMCDYFYLNTDTHTHTGRIHFEMPNGVEKYAMTMAARCTIACVCACVSVYG